MPYSEAQRRALFAIEGGSFKPGKGEPFHGISRRKAKKMLGEGRTATAGDAVKVLRKHFKS